MSGQIRKEQKAYYEILEKTQKGNLDITEWMVWFLQCLDQAIQGAEIVLEKVLSKARLWDSLANVAINERQRLMLNKISTGFEGNLTTNNWAKMTKCSHDTALRDINELIEKKVLLKNDAGGRSVSYLLRKT